MPLRRLTSDEKRLRRTAPSGLAPAPRRVPRRLRTNRDLRTLQRLMVHSLVHPLVGPGENELTPRWRDGRSMAEVAAEFIKPNARLTSFERLQIYARGYWYRLIDCVYSDCPALLAVLGPQRFSSLVRAYLAKYPSRSHSLRNLCARLPQFILEEKTWTAPDTAKAHAVARFEWAQTVAFDEGALPVVTPTDIAASLPQTLRLGLQPYLTLLELDWAVDDFVVALKKREALRSEASHAVDGRRRFATSARKPRLARRRTFVVVHRHANRLYYKRVAAAEFAILAALAAGKTLSRAVAAGGSAVTPAQVQRLFSLGMELGWFCRRR